MYTTTTAYVPAGAEASTGTRLLCFHHAGGAASAFTGWQQQLGPGVTVLPVQLPGRERRVEEPRFTDVKELAADLDASLDPLLEQGPYAFYGHSMGAIVAYHLALRRAEARRSLPVRLMVGAYPPPHILAPITRALAMSDEELARWLVDLGGMSEQLLSYPEWVRAALALLRDDLRVCRSHQVPGEPLPCPIDAFTGENDPLLPLAAVGGWERHTSVACEVHVIPGGHFFPQESAADFFPKLASLLSRRFSAR